MNDIPDPNPSPTPSPEPTPTPKQTPEPDPKPTPEPEPKKDAEPDPVVPEPVTLESLKVPEGLTIPDELGTKFLAVVNDTELSGADRAQALLDLQAEVARTASEGISKEFEQVREQWVKDAKALPDIGGDKLDETLGQIGTLIDEFDIADAKLGVEAGAFRKVLDESGLGDHPVVITFLHRIASANSEGGPTSGGPGGQPRSAADRIYDGNK